MLNALLFHAKHQSFGCKMSKHIKKVMQSIIQSSVYGNRLIWLQFGAVLFLLQLWKGRFDTEPLAAFAPENTCAPLCIVCCLLQHTQTHTVSFLLLVTHIHMAGSEVNRQCAGFSGVRTLTSSYMFLSVFSVLFLLQHRCRASFNATRLRVESEDLLNS